MDPSSSYWIELALYALFWLMTAFAASGETAITALNRIRLQATMERGASRAEAMKGILSDPRRSLATLIVLSTIGLIGGAASATLLAVATTGGPQRYITAVSLVFLLLLGQFIPKALAMRWPERVALFIAGPLDLLTTLFRPIVSLFGFFSSGGSERSTEMLAREEELRLLVDVGEEEGLIEEEEREMIEGVFGLEETVAREVMIPRIDIVGVETDTTLREALNVIIECGHSRIPVYEETIDHITGLLYAKDVLRHLRDRAEGDAEPTAGQMMRPAYYIPESKPVDDLLAELKRMKVHIAIVVDEYGGTAGLVTIEDLIEEIVGEIQDEYDVEEPISQTIAPNEVIYDARVDLDDINYELDLNLPTEDSDTLGGLIYTYLGRVPEVGDEVQIGHIRLTVLTMEGRRIGKVKLINEAPTSDEEPPADGQTRPVEAADEASEPTRHEGTWENTRRANGTA